MYIYNFIYFSRAKDLVYFRVSHFKNCNSIKRNILINEWEWVMVTIVILWVYTYSHTHKHICMDVRVLAFFSMDVCMCVCICRRWSESSIPVGVQVICLLLHPSKALRYLAYNFHWSWGLLKQHVPIELETMKKALRHQFLAEFKSYIIHATVSKS